MTTMQGALENDQLRSSALAVLNVFVTTLKYNDIAPFIGRTSAIFVGYWACFSSEDKQIVAATLTYFLDNSGEFRDRLDDLPDISQFPELSVLSTRLNTLREGWDLGRKIRVLLTRADNESAQVRYQALIELRRICAKERDQIIAMTTGDTFDKLISKVVSALLDNLSRSTAELQSEIQAVTYQILGTLGALDPDRMEVTATEPTICVLQEFTDKEESIDFALFLIVNELLGSYRSTNDSRGQQDLAYAIQELFRFCGFNEDLLRIESGPPSASLSLKARSRWSNLPKHVHESLATLLRGRYAISTLSKPRIVSYPIYASVTSYRVWIQQWSADLIRQVTGTYAKEIFSTLQPVVRSDDVAVAHALLPYLVVQIISSGSSQDCLNIQSELAGVLLDQINHTSDLPAESRRLAAQVLNILAF